MLLHKVGKTCCGEVTARTLENDCCYNYRTNAWAVVITSNSKHFSEVLAAQETVIFLYLVCVLLSNAIANNVQFDTGHSIHSSLHVGSDAVCYQIFSIHPTLKWQMNLRLRLELTGRQSWMSITCNNGQQTGRPGC